MKFVQYAIAACALVTVVACGTDSSGDANSGSKCEDVDSTFAQIQQQIFEAKGCTASACHGETANGGLDLRPESAYASLINVEASSGDYMRVFPGEQDLSLLYQKVAAKTDGFELGSLPNPISGGAMPTGPEVLSDDDLALLRVWIRSGAPEAGVVEGSQKYANCELEGEVAPNKIQPLPAPAPDEGVQFYSGGWTVSAEQEGEVCFVSYYDYSDRVPPELRVPCGELQGGPDRECFAYNKSLLAQDPQSHHSIIEFYVPLEGNEDEYDPNGDSWRNWKCNGGEMAGMTCTPGGDECGDRSQCTTEPLTAIACIGYPNGPLDMRGVGGLFGTATSRQNLATAQESSFRETYPENVYALAPVEGFIIWDSHAFNLTKTDTTIEQWLNLSFASPDQLLYQRRQIFDADDIFWMGRIDAYTSKEACGSFEIPQYGRLLDLSTHTHRFGKEFRVWYPPNEPCDNEVPGQECTRPAREPDYLSFDYADPLYQRFTGEDIMIFDSPDPKDRSFRYCAVWDNGESNPAEVRRNSIQPDAETCDFVAAFAPIANQAGLGLFACGCAADELSCFGGDNQGALCNGDDSVCGEGGICDACPLGGGVTTEEEMFILLGAYYVETP
ncbi:MAG: hypothetical protein AMJ63_13575 [Myxococcales bacterium SG8_38_1]|jgi:hypothetical protein|nr:MAG: hypothetical protein AMJ63_13575 [Myxococcales bacterium SG8_38_1]